MNDAAPAVEQRWEVPGLDDLIAKLRKAGLPIGPSEAIDGAELLRHQARATEPARQDRRALKGKLRPVLCKNAADIAGFDEVFDDWATLAPIGAWAEPSATTAARSCSPR